MKLEREDWIGLAGSTLLIAALLYLATCAVCVYASAVNRYAEGESEVVVRGYPMDCIPAPEPIGALASGLVLLAVLARSRSRRR